MNHQRQQYLFVGGDIHKDNHAFCGMNCFTDIELEKETNNSYADFEKLVLDVQRVAKSKNLKPVFALEDTYGNGEFLARFLIKRGMTVKNVNPVLVSRQRQYETHPEKSDLLDALEIAKVSIQKIDKLPNYSITSTTEIARNLRALSQDRDYLVKEQTRLKNQLHRLLHRSFGSCYRTICQKDIFGIRALKFWLKFPCLKSLKLSRTKRVKKPKWLENTSFKTIPEVSSIQLKQIKRKVRRLISLKNELSELTIDIEVLLRKEGQHLETLPGCSTVTAARLLSEIKDINNFSSPSKLAKYAGAAPRKYESGKQKRHKKTKSGNRKLNGALHRIALSQIGNRGSSLARAYYKKKIKQGKPKKQAIICLKRQIIKIIYSMLKEQRPYYI